MTEICEHKDCINVQVAEDQDSEILVLECTECGRYGLAKLVYDERQEEMVPHAEIWLA